MSRACAERCGLMRLVDTRFKGVAMGVGTQKILGRVHVVQMQILDKVTLRLILVSAMLVDDPRRR